MIDPDIIEPLCTLIAAVITGIFGIIIARIQRQEPPGEMPPSGVGLVGPDGKPLQLRPQPPKPLHSIRDSISRLPRTLVWSAVIVLVLLGASVGSIIGGRLRNLPFTLPAAPSEGEAAALTATVSTAESTPTPQPISTATPDVPPTTIARGRLLMEINFAVNGDGDCNQYDAAILGYDNRQYYIQPPASRGYIAVCHNGTWAPRGSLQVTAYPDEESTTFGYGVLFGWAGGGLSTTDACIFGIRRRWGSTEAVFSEQVANSYASDSQKLSSVSLDSSPHTLRVTLQPDGSVAGYLDEHFIAEYRFSKCREGPIGLVAWGGGNGETRIYFDDLKLFDLP